MNRMCRYRFFSIALIVVCFFVVAISTASAAVCELPDSGVGGTGYSGESTGGSGVGGTGIIYRNGSGTGTGGTGKPVKRNKLGARTEASNSGSGVGGTGLSTDKPLELVIGKITGFASICVNGIEIHYAQNTPVKIEGIQDSATGDLRIGQTVVAHVFGFGNEAKANSIDVIYPVIGPVTVSNINSGRLEVLGQSVILPPGIASTIKSINVGQFVKVSGVTDAKGQILASRIDVTNSAQASIKGLVTSVSATSFNINNLKINMNASNPVSVGDRVQALGSLINNGRELVNSIVQQQTTMSLMPGIELSVEGVVVANNNQMTLDIGGRVLAIKDDSFKLLNEMPTLPVIVRGQVGQEGEIEIDSIIIETLLERPETQPLHSTKGKSDDNNVEEKNNIKGVEKGERHEETFELRTDQVETPEVETPEVETPEVETPEVEVPEVEVPEVEVPEVEVPEVEVPEVEVPEIEVPEIEVPEIEVPEIEVPEIEVPEIEIPEIEIPEIEIPEIEIPEIEIPEIEVPEIEVPEIEIPEIEVPEIEIPEIEIPEIEIPEVEVPET